MAYIVVSCAVLNDQWECDADRKPISIIEDIRDVLRFTYYAVRSIEVWAPHKNGFFTPIDYKDLTRLVFNAPELKFHYDEPLTDNQAIKDFVYALYYD